jgi:hypothetical protein
MTVYARGCFGFQPVIGLAEHHWPAGNYESEFMGLPAAGQHISGAFVAGAQRLVPIRQLQNELAVRFLLFEGPDGGDLKLTDASGFAGVADVEARDGRWGHFQPGRKPRFAFASDQDSVLWREPGKFEVIGQPAGHAIQIAIPDAEEPWGYRVRFWRVQSGLANDTQVSGFLTHEQVYVRPGAGWFTSRYMTDLEVFWIGFFTEFEDGSVLQGSICRGRQNFSFAAVQPSDGAASVSTDVSVDVDVDENGYPVAGEFALGDGSRWRYDGGSGGRMLLPGDTPRWRDGVVTRAGETRAVTFGASWAEVFPERLNAPI